MITATITYKGATIVAISASSIAIAYSGSTVATLSEAGTTTLATNGCLMRGNISIGNKTLLTAGKLMTANIVITAVVTTYTITPTPGAHVSADSSNPTEILPDGSATLIFFSDDGYNFDKDTPPTVVNAEVDEWTVEEVSAWEYPSLDETTGELTITQLYGISQSGDELTIE